MSETGSDLLTRAWFFGSLVVLNATFSMCVRASERCYGACMGQLDRITLRPDMMGGRACIRGMRVTVGMLVGQIGTGRTIDDVLADYPYLEREDIMQALQYAAWLVVRPGCSPHETPDHC